MDTIVLTINHLRLILLVGLIVIVLNLAGFIGGLVAIDDNPEVLNNNSGKYAYLILMTIIYLLVGLGFVAGLGSTFMPNLPKGELFCNVKGTGFGCDLIVKA